jgi:hypothetical protein
MGERMHLHADALYAAAQHPSATTQHMQRCCGHSISHAVVCVPVQIFGCTVVLALIAAFGIGALPSSSSHLSDTRL